MGFNDRLIFPDPAETRLYVERVPVEGAECPKCGSDDVRRYPIGWVKGPRMVVKCQACFHTLELTRPEPEDNWPPFQAAAYDWEASPSESAGGDLRRARQAEATVSGSDS